MKFSEVKLGQVFVANVGFVRMKFIKIVGYSDNVLSTDSWITGYMSDETEVEVLGRFSVETK